VSWFVRHARAESVASYNVLGRPLVGEADEFDQAKVEIERLQLLEAGQIPSLTFEQAMDHIDRLAEDDDFRLCVEAILTAQVQWAWTAFETLAGDLWEAALNAHPRVLASLDGKRRKRRKESEPDQGAEEPAKGAKGKAVPLALLQQHGYDLQDKMGTVLAGRFNFSRLEGIREAYQVAFSLDHGKIDEKIVRRTKTRFPRFSDYQKGQQLALHGEMVAQLVSPSIVSAVAMIRAVDDWLVKHPE
jgi:hypothetical protein